MKETSWWLASRVCLHYLSEASVFMKHDSAIQSLITELSLADIGSLSIVFTAGDCLLHPDWKPNTRLLRLCCSCCYRDFYHFQFPSISSCERNSAPPRAENPTKLMGWNTLNWCRGTSISSTLTTVGVPHCTPSEPAADPWTRAIAQCDSALRGKFA